MTEKTYDIIAKNLDKVSNAIHQAEESNDISKLRFLSAQLKALKENFHRLLWAEIPSMNDIQKYKVISKNSTGMVFHPGIFELDIMRQAFFKRQAMAFFETEEEQQAYIAYTEEQYLRATVNLKEIYFKANHTQPKMTHREKMEQVKSEFAEAMK